MSAIASFTKVPRAALDGLRKAAVPNDGLLGTSSDRYDDYLQKSGTPAADYRWSGFVLATLLVYLEKHHQINLMRLQYDELAPFLTTSRGATHFIFTNAHKQAFLTKLDGRFSEDALRDYYNKFNETNDAEAGKPMLDGIRSLGQSLRSLDEASVIVFSIG